MTFAPTTPNLLRANSKDSSMNVPLLLGIFAIVAFPVMLVFWIYDSAKGARDYMKSPPEQKQMTREFHKEALALSKATKASRHLNAVV